MKNVILSGRASNKKISETHINYIRINCAYRKKEVFSLRSLGIEANQI